MTTLGKGYILLFIYVCLIFNIGSISTKENVDDDIVAKRNVKSFSLFSVVTFKNEECTSETSFTGGAVKGTCYSTTECSDKAGTASGNCASGFGVCCTFVSNIGTATISENRTYLQSLLFPAIETSVAAITYTINKMQEDICQIRLDFDTFAIAGPSATDETGYAATTYTTCSDMMTTTLTSNAIVPILCGQLKGLHIYLDVGMDAANTAQLALTFAANPTAATAFRSWRIKTAQIPCWAAYRAPHGCHQYLYGSSFGQIWSPNFRTGPSTNQGTAANNNPNYAVDLAGLDLKICIRREKGMCCTLFQVCNYDPDSVDLAETVGLGNIIEGSIGMISPGFSFNMDCYGVNGAGGTDGTFALRASAVGKVDQECTSDYVEIPDSTQVKSYGAPVVTNSRYCCNRFGNVPGPATAGTDMSHAPVYACTEPFEVLYHTDQLADEASEGITNASPVNLVPRGLCLLYKQEGC